MKFRADIEEKMLKDGTVLFVFKYADFPSLNFDHLRFVEVYSTLKTLSFVCNYGVVSDIFNDKILENFLRFNNACISGSYVTKKVLKLYNKEVDFEPGDVDIYWEPSMNDTRGIDDIPYDIIEKKYVHSYQNLTELHIKVIAECLNNNGKKLQFIICEDTRHVLREIIRKDIDFTALSQTLHVTEDHRIWLTVHDLKNLLALRLVMPTDTIYPRTRQSRIDKWRARGFTVARVPRHRIAEEGVFDERPGVICGVNDTVIDCSRCSYLYDCHNVVLEFGQYSNKLTIDGCDVVIKSGSCQEIFVTRSHVKCETEGSHVHAIRTDENVSPWISYRMKQSKFEGFLHKSGIHYYNFVMENEEIRRLHDPRYKPRNDKTRNHYDSDDSDDDNTRNHYDSDDSDDDNTRNHYDSDDSEDG